MKINIDYKKLCLQKLHYLATKALKQLIYNYVATISWEYKELKNKMSCQKNVEFYCSCILLPNGTLYK